MQLMEVSIYICWPVGVNDHERIDASELYRRSHKVLTASKGVCVYVCSGVKLNLNVSLPPVCLGSGLQVGSVAGCRGSARRCVSRSNWPAGRVQSCRGGRRSGRRCPGVCRRQPGPETAQGPSGATDETVKSTTGARNTG